MTRLALLDINGVALLGRAAACRQEPSVRHRIEIPCGDLVICYGFAEIGALGCKGLNRHKGERSNCR